jgi:monovalent cation:H+ antiporter-2, CPA2 family
VAYAAGPHMDAHAFLLSLTIILGVAAITTVLFQRLHQPVVLGYVLAGFIIGPNCPFPLVADRQVIQTLSELGVVLLMFSLGLEFSLGKLLKLGPSASLTAILETSLMIWLGFMVGRAFGWSTVESLFTGTIIAISSTTIIARAFDEHGVRGSLRERVVGILVVEDLIAILLMATLTAVASGAGLSATDVAKTSGKLVLFLVGLITVGLLFVPRAVRLVARLGRPETTLVASVGFCFGVSLLAQSFGYSVALGAFIAGSLIAESGKAKAIEHLIRPVRDLFAAIFFVSVGVLIDPRVIGEHWLAILVLTSVVLVGKIVGVSLGAFLTGHGVRASIQTGMSLAQIGEFSFIIAGLGLSLKATGEFLYPVAVTVSAVTTLTTPLLIKRSGPFANWVDRKMPHSLQTFLALYGSWMEDFRSKPQEVTRGRSIRRLTRLLILDTGVLAVIAIGASAGLPSISRFVAAKLGLDPNIARLVILAGAGALAVPLIAGIARVARQLGLTIALAALPATQEGALDLAATPRRALIVTLQFGIVLLTGLPLLALTQPFLGGFYAPAIFAVLLVGFGIAFWRGATELQGHVRAGASAILEALVEQSRKGSAAPSQEEPPDSLLQVHRLLPGLGEPTPIRLDPSSAAVGKSLAELNLRGATGATVLAIQRGEDGLLIPTAGDVLRAGDVLALAGTHDAVGAAKQLLSSNVSARVDD